MGRRRGIGRRRAVATIAALATVVFAGCLQGRLLLGPVKLRPPQGVRPTGLSIAVEGVPRMEGDKYQALVEREIVRAIRDSGLFRAVSFGAEDVESRDLVLRIQRATAAWDRRPTVAGIPLSLATLTLYIWVGGPLHTDTEFYDITLSLFDSDGTHLFDVHRREKHSHWLGLYSPERYEFRCRGPHAGEVISGVVEELGRRVADLRAGRMGAAEATP